MLTALLVFLPFGFGITDYIIGKKSEKTRNSFAVITTFIELALSVLLLLTVIRGGSSSLLNLDIPHVFASGMSLRADGFRSVYSLVTALMWAFTTLFSQEYFRHEPENLNRYYLFVLATLGATQGVMLSGDLMTTFVKRQRVRSVQATLICLLPSSAVWCCLWDLHCCSMKQVL